MNNANQQIVDLLGGGAEEATNDQGLEGDQDAFEGEEFEDEEFEGEEFEGEENDDSEEFSETWGSALGIDDEKIVLDYNGKVAGIKTKVDGEEQIVPLNELVQGYQFNAHNTRTAQALGQQKLQLQQAQQQWQAQQQQELTIQMQLANVIKEQILGDYANLDWEKFNAEQPENARIAYGEYRKREDYFNNLIGATSQQIQQLQQMQQQQMQQQQMQYAQQQVVELVARIPEWTDVAVAKQDMSNIQNVMSEYGFSNEEVSTLLDARIYHVLKDFAKLKGALNKVQSTVKSAPVTKQHGNVGNKNAGKVNRLVRKASQASNNYQKQQLKTAAIAELLGG